MCFRKCSCAKNKFQGDWCLARAINWLVNGQTGREWWWQQSVVVNEGRPLSARSSSKHKPGSGNQPPLHPNLVQSQPTFLHPALTTALHIPASFQYPPPPPCVGPALMPQWVCSAERNGGMGRLWKSGCQQYFPLDMGTFPRCPLQPAILARQPNICSPYSDFPPNSKLCAQFGFEHHSDLFSVWISIC